MACYLRTESVPESGSVRNLQVLSSLTSKGRDTQGPEDKEIRTEEFKAML